MIDEFDRDERESLVQGIAAGLAELSCVDRPPSEVDQTSEFDEGDVPQDDGGLIYQVIKMQDWLRVHIATKEERSLAEVSAELFAAVGANPSQCSTTDGGEPTLTLYGLTRLRDRVDRAVSIKDKFVEVLEESGSLSGATSTWAAEWDDLVEESTGEPVVAKALTWNIKEFSYRAGRGRLNLSPSYQRGDVWPVKDRQLLIESILRGIPLPSVIILKTGAKDVAFEVVDGKQRLTSILMFMGAHPDAVKRVANMDREFPKFNLEELFSTDYAKFKQSWKRATGETLSASKEAEYYFPFKLGGTLADQPGALGTLAGKYYPQIKETMLEAGGESVEVQDIFESSPEYKIPVIQYTQATRRQIHEVFNLYNKQGKHLNAEEIRNAVYHEVELMRVLSVVAGDNAKPDAQFLSEVAKSHENIAVMLEEFKFGDARYRKTKVLSWLFSLIFSESLQENGQHHRPLSTAQQTNSLLDRIGKNLPDPLNDRAVIRSALDLVETAMEAHSAAPDAWCPKFKDTKNGAKWQELQLIASLVGVSLAAVVLGPSCPQVVADHQDSLERKTSSSDWMRPKKTQTSEQWKYIARVALGIVDALDVNLDEVASGMTRRFGFSPVAALRDAASGRQVGEAWR